MGEQVSGLEESPPPHVHPDSTWQLEEHPSPLTEFPSSQYWAVSLVTTSPSPQMSVQVSADVGEPPVHPHPGSIMHSELQPSPLAMFPSSHSVSPPFFPSPQIGVQTSGEEGVPSRHYHPSSTVQVAEQPSPLTVLPSSQAYFPKSNPSPQISLQVSGLDVVPPVQS